MIVLKDSVEKKHANYTTTFFFMFYFSVIAFFCTYIEYISKNAIHYLHFINASSILCAIIILTLAVDSPLRNFEKGNQDEGRRLLSYIAKFNSTFSRSAECSFENTIICSTQEEVATLQSEFTNSEKSPSLKGSCQSAVIPRSPLSDIKEIWSEHKLVFFTLIVIKSYIDIAWFLNVYTLQAYQTDESSVFFNGMILGCVSMFAISSSGLIMKYFNPLSLQLVQAVVCLIITVYFLACLLYEDKMTPEQKLITSKLTLLFSYITMYSVDQQYICYMQSAGLLIPSSILIFAIEIQMAIAVGFTQLIPYIILMDDIPKRIFHLAFTVVVVVAYVIIWVKGNKK